MASRAPTKKIVKRQQKGFSRNPKLTKAIQLALKENLERKFKDTDIDTGTITTTGTLSLVSTIAQGSTVSERSGDSVTFKSVVLRGRISAIADGISFCRYILFQWLPNSTPTTAQILENVGSDAIIISPFNHAYRQSFKVLWDSGALWVSEKDDLANNGMQIATPIPLLVIPSFPVPKVTYSAASSTDSNGRIYFLYCASIANSVSSKFNIRLNYYDA